MDVYVGIEGVNIKGDKGISLDDLMINGKPKLSLNIKPPQDLSPLIKGGLVSNEDSNPEERRIEKEKVPMKSEDT